jgi:hypothetical protein
MAPIDHLFLVVEENNGGKDTIGKPAAPNGNALAQEFGVATRHDGGGRIRRVQRCRRPGRERDLGTGSDLPLIREEHGRSWHVDDPVPGATSWAA